MLSLHARTLWIVGLAVVGLVVAVGALWTFQYLCHDISLPLTGALGPRRGLCGVLATDPPWTLLGALVAAPSVLYSWWSRTTHKDQEVAHALRQLEHARAQLEHEKDNACDDLAAKQFNDAVELLCSDDAAKQSAGVYSLQRVARYSAREVEAVCEVLASYIRLRSEIDEYTWCGGLQPPVDRELGATIQAALLVLGTIKGTLRVSLRRLDLFGVRIEGDFSNVDFEGTVFEHATLRGDFSGARFVGAAVVHARFAGTFKQANFHGSSYGGSCDVDESAEFAGATGNLPGAWLQALAQKAAGSVGSKGE